MQNLNCPHCQRELPVNHPENWCPFCGRDLGEEETVAVPATKINWLLFFAILLAPAILSLIGVSLDLGTLIVGATFGGSLLAGTFCADLLDKQRGYSSAVKWCLAAVFALLSFILCFGGCVAGAMVQMKHQ